MYESDIVEFKRELNDKLEVEVVSFLNGNGGHIFIGISDDGCVYGVNDPDNIQLQIKDRIKDKISPSPVGYFEIILEEKDDKHIIHIVIASGREKPYYLKKYGMCPKGCYIRVGSSCVELSEKSIYDLYSKRTRTSLVNIISPIHNLTFKQLRIYYEERGYEINDNTLAQLNFYLDSKEYNYLAYLLSDQNSLVFNVGRFRGNNVVDLVEMKSISNQSLIKTTYEILDYIENENKTFTKISSPNRIEVKLFDTIAIREALINAIVHSDYSYENTPTFRLFDDHMEIISVGGLPEGIEKDEFLGGYMSPKNPKLMKVFRDLGLVEHMGTGIIRILSKYDKSIFNFSTNFIKVSIPYSSKSLVSNKNENKKHIITERQKEIMKYIEENESITQDELSDRIGVSRYTIIREMKILEERNLIERVGSNKVGHWIVN